MTEEDRWYCLCSCPNLWQKGIAALLETFGSPEKVLTAKAEQLLAVPGIDKDIVYNLTDTEEYIRRLRDLEKLKDEGIQFIYRECRTFPKRLKVLQDCPFSLYVKGNLPNPGRLSVGMVGARSCSFYGRDSAIDLAGSLAACGVQIISGMAHGIDAYSAKGALDVSGRTFAVLGSGIDVIYPKDNIELYYQIALSGGGVISEYPPGTAPAPWQFPHRNRLIAALSDSLVVIEAGKHSGTLITAAYALNQGKDIYALPGRIDDTLSEGCNRLIADGAEIIVSKEQLLEDITGVFKEPAKASSGTIQEPEDERLKTVFRCVDRYPKSVLFIAERAGIPETDAAAALTELELLGLVCEVTKDFYAK